MEGWVLSLFTLTHDGTPCNSSSPSSGLFRVHHKGSSHCNFRSDGYFTFTFQVKSRRVSFSPGKGSSRLGTRSFIYRKGVRSKVSEPGSVFGTLGTKDVTGDTVRVQPPTPTVRWYFERKQSRSGSKGFPLYRGVVKGSFIHSSSGYFLLLTGIVDLVDRSSSMSFTNN